jgi:arylsulfatase A-like enzyme
MLKVSFERPHSPYDPPPRFWDMYHDADMPEPHIGKWSARFAPHKVPPPTTLWHGNLGVDQARRSRHGYYGNVSFVDEEIGRILNVLKERGWYDNTLIIFFADHGDMLGDHNLWRKSYAYEGSTHIPMILRWPASLGYAERRGQRIDLPVELRDVLPTFLDAAGAEVPEGVDGRSLLQLVRGQTQSWREAIDMEHDVCYSVENYWNGMTDGRWKYIFHAYDGREQLFHLEEDPGELHNLADDPGYQGVLREWRDRLIEHLSERGEPFVKDGRLLIRRKRMLYSPNYPGLGR